FLEGLTDEKQNTMLNVRKVLDGRELLDRPLPRPLARQMLHVDKHITLEGWLRSLPQKAKDSERARWLAGELRRLLEPEDTPIELPAALTYKRTATREFEVAYWDTIADLSTGTFLNKNNADCVTDDPTKEALHHHRRDLEPLGEYLLGYHSRII